MESTIKEIDLNKLIRLSSYAKREGYTRGRIYQLAQSGKLNIVEIDTVKFVNIN